MAWFNNGKIEAAEGRLNTKIIVLEIREDKNYEMLMNISNTLAEVKVELKYMNEKIDKP